MIKFLTKLANELDKIGLQKLSDKIDKEIFKISQALTGPTPAWKQPDYGTAPANQPRVPQITPAPDVVPEPTPEQETFGPAENMTPQLMTQLQNTVQQMETLIAGSSQELQANNVLNQTVQALLAKVKDVIKAKNFNDVVGDIQSWYKSYQSIKDVKTEFGEQYSQLLLYFIDTVKKLEAGTQNNQVARKAPAKQHKADKSTTQMISDIQQLLMNAGGQGVSVSGKWDTATNASFIQYLSMHHKDLLKPNPKNPKTLVFTGDIVKAWSTIMRDFNYNKVVTTNKSPNMIPIIQD